MQLFGIYGHRYGEESQMYNDKITKIHEINTCVEQFKYLDVIISSLFESKRMIDSKQILVDSC